MAITVKGIPGNWRAPGVYIGNQPRNGGGQVGLRPTMIIGQMLSTGTAIANTPVQVFSQADVDALTGVGSMLSRMYAAYSKNDITGPVWLTPVVDGVGTAGTVAVTLTGTATETGTNVLYVNNYPVYGAVAVGDTAVIAATTLATAITASVNTTGVTASAAAGVITLTSANKGITAGDVQVKANKNGLASGERTPAGLTVVVGAPVAGTIDSDLTVALANIAPLPFSFLVVPYTTTAVNTQVNTLLSDTVGRWGPLSQIFGGAFNAIRGTLAATTTYGASVNGNHTLTLPILDSQTPAYIAAAIFGGLAASISRSNVALPIVGTLIGLDAPSITQRLRRTDENTLLFTGISSTRVDNAGNVKLTRAISNYQTDTGWLAIEPQFCVEYADTYIRSDLESKYAQVSLVADGNPVTPGSGAVTPSLILGHVNNLYLDLEALGVVQNSAQFIAQSYVEADLTAGVVSLYLPIQCAGQLRIIKILNSFS